MNKQIIKSKVLIWGKTSSEEMNWEEAKKWCEKQGGRLPTITELVQAWEEKVEGFEDDYYWSASEVSATNAYYLHFCFGLVYSGSKSSSGRVRCVREEPQEELETYKKGYRDGYKDGFNSISGHNFQSPKYNAWT